MLWCKEGCAAVRMQAVHIHRMLWWKKGVLSAPHAASCLISQNALVEEGCATCAAMLAAVMIHRMLWWNRCAIPALHASSLLLQITECSGEGCAIPAAMQARCCCDPQNALVEEGCYPCAAMQARCCCDHRMLWWKVCYPCAAMHAACMIHRMLVEEGVLSLRCHVPLLL
jgi:hypothetical protein